MPPKTHSYLPYVTKSIDTETEESYCWHIPVDSNINYRFGNINNLKWICLRAESQK